MNPPPKTNPTFQVTAHAKWILAGEHAVLRGHPALVFPVPEKFIKLTFQSSENPLNVDFLGPYGDTLLLIFWGILEESLKLIHKRHEDMRGKFTLLNNIPMGAGMGFSAALCVAVSRWIQWSGWIKENELFDFARTLENFFHGKSSGVDIAGALCQQATYFTQAQGFSSLQLTWRPNIFLSYSEKISMTAQCIDKVNKLWETNATLADKLDNSMRDSVEQAKLSLTSNNLSPSKKEAYLAAAINKANDCFEHWGLNKGELKEHIDQLMQHGALAAKATGAGNGGYVISLWKQAPKKDIPFNMTKVV